MATTLTKSRPTLITEPAQRPGRARDRDRRTGGALLASAGAAAFMAIITAEALYPAPFSTANNTISDLGATLPPNSVILQPSATIFDIAMIVAGLTITAGAVFVHRAFARKAVTIPLALFGIGALGVGIFPGNNLAPHQLFAMTAFISGGVAAVMAAKVLVAPLRQLSVVMGVASLVSFLLAMSLLEWGPVAELGEGGIERWIVYPAILWLTMFGGALMGALPPSAKEMRAVGEGFNHRREAESADRAVLVAAGCRRHVGMRALERPHLRGARGAPRTSRSMRPLPFGTRGAASAQIAS